MPQQTDHNVLIIHPEVKQLTPSRGVTNRTQLVPGQPHQSSPDVKEAHALIDSLGGWSIVDTVSFKVKHSVRNNRPTFFTRGIWEEVTDTVERYHAERLPRDATLTNERTNPDLSHPEYPVTAVFVNWPQLSTSQILRMSAAWRLPVYDRYTLVVHLFNLRAQNQEARIQAELAQISLLKARLPTAVTSFVPVVGQKENVFRFGAGTIDRLSQLLRKREVHLLEQATVIERHRQTSRDQRQQNHPHQYPVVAVVGYTNAGKTSLIRCLSGNRSVVSSPQVFATLDLTLHRARLPITARCTMENRESPTLQPHCGKVAIPGVNLLLLDTIGFMADLPTNLIAAFRATLMQSLHADLVIHVVDVSDPAWEKRMSHVEQVLSRAGVPTGQNASTFYRPAQHTTSLQISPPAVLRVGNKVDSVLDHIDEQAKANLDVLISAKQGTGVCQLTELIEAELARRLQWTRRTLKMKQGSEALQWLYSNAMVIDVSAIDDDPGHLTVSALFTPSSWGRMQTNFRIGPTQSLQAAEIGNL
ncbi:unnamed protein product [Dicrocoelium dendriticum]|nr:unnamed protein product [Dicrocoelium dendriticum]